MNDGSATTPVDTMSSERESIPSSPPTRTILDQHQNVQPNKWQAYSNYPPLNSEFAIEDMSLYPTKQPSADDIDEENIEFIKSRSNTMDSPAAPRPLPKTPLVNAKADDDNLDKIQDGHAFDALIGGMLTIVKSGGETPEPAGVSVAVNSAAARGAAFLGSLAPRWDAEKHRIASKKTNQEDKNWVDDVVADHKAEAAARMARFLAGGDDIVAINDQAEAPKPKKKNKNKMSSKKKRQMKARKAGSKGALTSAEAQHPTPQHTTNVTDEEIPSSDASTAAGNEHEHDASLQAMDENSAIYKNEKPEDASTSAGQNTPQYTAQENTKIHLNDRSDDASTSAGQGTPQYATHENTEIYTNKSQEDAATSAEHDTSLHTTQENSELYTNKRSAMEEKAIADEMTDSAIRVAMTSRKGKEQLEARVHQTVTHEAGASDGFAEHEIANVNDCLSFFNGKIEQHDKLFVEIEGLIQSLVAEIRGLHGLSGKYDKVIDDLRTLFTRTRDMDTRGRMNRYAIRELKTSVVEHESATPSGSDQPVMDLAGLRDICRDAKQLQAGAGTLGTSETQKLASTVGRLQIELNEAVRRIDNDISKYGEINNQLQSSIKTVKTDIVGLHRTSKATKWELAEVVKAATDLDENVGTTRDTLNQIVEAAHIVPTLQQASAKYDHAMKEIENASAKCDKLKEIVDYNSDAVKKRNDEIVDHLDQHAERLNKHGERLNNCHRLYTETCDVVEKQEGHLNTLDNKVRAHQKLIAKVTSQSDSSARRLHSLTETTARDIKALSESTSRVAKSLSDTTSRDIKDTFEQLKETQAQLGTLKTTVDSQALTLASKVALGEQEIEDIVMQLLDAIASKIDRICAKIEAYLGPLDHLSPNDDGSPKPKLTHAQKKNQKRAIAVARAAVETQQTSVPATRDANSAAQTEISGTSPDAESEVEVPKVRMRQIDRIRSESISKTPAAASPAPIAPHPSPPSRLAVTAQPPMAMQILKCPGQRSPSLARSETHLQDGPLPERVAMGRRKSMQRRDSMGFGNGMAGQGMMSPMAMDRVMMAPQNAHGEVYGLGQMVVAQQQVVYTQQQMVTAPPPGLGSQQTGLLPQMFDQDYDQEYGQQQSGQQQLSQQFCQAYDPQNDPQHSLGHDFDYQIGHPLAIIPVDENIQPAAYIPQQDPRDHQLMLLTYNMDNLNARVNEATNAMSVAQSSIRNLRTGLRYEISQEVEREVERRVGTALNGAEARLVRDINRRMNNTERRLNDKSTREEKRLVQILPMLEQLMRREGLELPPPDRN